MRPKDLILIPYLELYKKNFSLDLTIQTERSIVFENDDLKQLFLIS